MCPSNWKSSASAKLFALSSKKAEGSDVLGLLGDDTVVENIRGTSGYNPNKNLVLMSMDLVGLESDYFAVSATADVVDQAADVFWSYSLTH